MIVEDDPFLGPVVSEILKSGGFATHLFREPVAALAAFQARPESFDLVLTDYNMPGMDGLEMIRSMRYQRPDLPAILVSGHPPEHFPENVSFMAKPVRYDDLLALIREKTVVDRPGPIIGEGQLLPEAG